MLLLPYSIVRVFYDFIYLGYFRLIHYLTIKRWSLKNTKDSNGSVYKGNLIKVSYIRLTRWQEGQYMSLIM